MPWVFAPHSGGVKIPPTVQDATRRRLLTHAEKHYKGCYLSLDIRFRGVLCYVDAFLEPDVPPNWPPKDWGETREEFILRLCKTPAHLVRLRHFAPDRWSVAFYTYSNDRYEPAAFPNGTFFGTPEEALDIGSVYLRAKD